MDNTNEWEDFKAEYLPTISLSNKEGKAGAYLVGTYLGSRAVEYRYKGTARKQNVHTFLLIETNQPLTQDVDGHLVEVSAKSDQKVEVWGAGQLDWFLSKVQKGKKVRIDYTGKTIIDGQSTHQFSFKVSKEAALETFPF